MKFYKITSKEESQYGVRYVTGLNEDINPIDTNVFQTSGGISFYREDILAFLNCGCWIREVTVPEGESVYENTGIPKQWKASRVILGQNKLITPSVIKGLIKEGADVNAGAGIPLRWAVITGNLSLAEIMLNNGADIHVNMEAPLREAVEQENIELIKFLLKKGADADVAMKYFEDTGCLAWYGMVLSKVVKTFQRENIMEDLIRAWESALVLGVPDDDKVKEHMIESLGKAWKNALNSYYKIAPEGFSKDLYKDNLAEVWQAAPTYCSRFRG